MRPIWPMLHKMLGLPEFLLGPQDPAITRSASSAQSPSKGRSLHASIQRRGSSPGSSPHRVPNPRVTSQSSQDFILGGAATKTIRLMNTFLDILRIFSTYHLSSAGLGILSGERHMVSRYSVFYTPFLSIPVGDLVHIKTLGQHIVVVNSLDIASELFGKRSSIYSDRPTFVMMDEL